MYPTDLTETQWQFIEKTLNFGTRKRKHSLRLIWDAINPDYALEIMKG